MTPAFPARRRADEFNDLVESLSAGRGAAADAQLDTSADLRALAAFAASLAEVPVPQPRAAFSVELRARLMTAAATELAAAAPVSAGTDDAVADSAVRANAVRASAVRDSALADKLTVRGLAGDATKPRRQRRLTIAVATLAILGGTAGTALASQSALPGDTLYPVKRAIENVETSLSQGDQSKGKHLISDADTRLVEVDKLSARRQADQAEEIASTLAAFSSQAQHASSLLMQDYETHHDASSITELHQFTQQSIRQLTQISATLPAVVQPALTQAAQTLIAIDRLAQQACPACGSLGITQLPSSLISATGQTLQQLTGGLTGQSGTTSSAGGDTGQHGTQPQVGLPHITLPKINGTLPPASLPSAAATSTAPQVDKSSAPVAKQTTTSTSTSRTTRKPKGTSPAQVATSVPSQLGTVVGQVTSGVTGVVKGIVGGLLGGTGS